MVVVEWGAGVAWGGVGVKLASSSESVGSAHSYPPSQNIRINAGTTGGRNQKLDTALIREGYRANNRPKHDVRQGSVVGLGLRDSGFWVQGDAMELMRVEVRAQKPNKIWQTLC